MVGNDAVRVFVGCERVPEMNKTYLKFVTFLMVFSPFFLPTRKIASAW